MDKRPVTIQDVAYELGVSTATVSNVIHGKTRKIGRETVALVERKLEEMGYLPRQAHILLGKNPSALVGIVINDHEKYGGHPLEDGYLSKVLNSLVREAERRGYLLIVKLARSIDDVPVLASVWNMEAVIVQGFCQVDYRKLKMNMHRPLIILDGFFSKDDEYNNLEIDHFEGGVLAGKYLKEMGHEFVVCISDNDICMDRLRYQGLCEVLPESVLMVVPSGRKERWAFFRENFTELMNNTAAFCVSDFYALDLIRFLNTMGVRVPEDFSVIGFDDIPGLDLTIPPLTTVRQDTDERAVRTFDMIGALKADPGYLADIRLTPVLAERSSVKKLS